MQKARSDRLCRAGERVWVGKPPHTLSPAHFSHPLSAASCLGYASGLCRPTWACFFLFLPISGFPQLPLSEWRRNQFSLTQGCRCPGFAHNWVTRLQQGRSGPLLVSFPYLAFKIAHRATRGRVWFFPQNGLTPPPKGGGAGYRFSWVRSVCPARSQPGHSGPTGPVWGFGGVVSYPVPQTRAQALTGPSLGFNAFSWGALSQAVLPYLSPACSLPPPG